MPSIGGIGPEQAWTFLYVVVCLVLLIPSVLKIVEFVQKQNDRKAEKNREQKQQTEGIANTLEDRLEKIEIRLDVIDGKLDRDNRRMNELEKKTDTIQDGFRALCTASLALLRNAPANGNDEEMAEAQKGLEAYLISR